MIMGEDTDDKDDTKRRSRNLSEKKRRDQFNILVNELSSMVSTSSRKMDKSTVLKSTIAFLKNHNELAVRSRAHEIQEDWKPAFLSNEEFTHLILEAVDGFIIVFSSGGQVVYVSGSVTSLLGHLPTELMNGSMTVYDVVYEQDHATVYNVLSSCGHGLSTCLSGKENQIEFSCHVRRGDVDYRDEPVYELVHFVGHFRTDTDNSEVDNVVSSTNRYSGDVDSVVVFVGTARLDTPQLIREMSISDASKTEFTSRHNLDWKFLSLDSRATPIIGYVQLEVVGTSGYDYYHIDDLDKIVTCHEALMEKGEGTSCHYRFLTKGQQWVWLQTRFYISYHQWNSKPEFIVCTHRVVSYVDVMIQARKDPAELQDSLGGDLEAKRGMPASPWSSKASSAGKLMDVGSPGSQAKRSRMHGSYSTSMHADSPGSHHSQMTSVSMRSSRGQGSTLRHPPAPTTRPPPLSPAQASTTFIEPPQQYVTAIPLQPLIGGYPAVVTSLPAAEMPRDPHIQQQPIIQDHLKRKQEELHRLRQLMFEKEEEIQQFVMAQTRYGIIPSIINVPGSTVSSTTSQSGSAITVCPVSVSSDMYLSQHAVPGRSNQLSSSSDLSLQPQVTLLHGHSRASASAHHPYQ